MSYDRKYFVGGTSSNYEDYRSKKFGQLAKDLVDEFRLHMGSHVLDFGCATGGLVAHLKKLGIRNVIGTDISTWAVRYGRSRYRLSNHDLQYYNRQLLEDYGDCVLLLDVLEHIPMAELREILGLLRSNRIVVRIPVSFREGGDYVLQVSRNDKTHIQCHTKAWWRKLFFEYGYEHRRPIKRQAIYSSRGVMAEVLSR